MDIMQQAPGLALVLLALVDATSIGTLIIPIWLLLRRNYREVIPKILMYLGIIAGFYWLVGLALRAGWNLSAGVLPQGFFQHSTTRLVMLVLGAGMVLWALFSDTREQKAAKTNQTQRLTGARAGESAAESVGDRRQGVDTEQTAMKLSPGWQKLVGRALDSRGGLMVLALIAGLLELPTMLPYLGAMNVLHASGWPSGVQVLVLAGYCLVMILPALVLVLVRALAGDVLDTWLQRLGSKLGRYAQEAVGWVVGIAGFLIVRSALDGVQLEELLHFIR